MAYQSDNDNNKPYDGITTADKNKFGRCNHAICGRRSTHHLLTRRQSLVIISVVTKRNKCLIASYPFIEKSS